MTRPRFFDSSLDVCIKPKTRNILGGHNLNGNIVSALSYYPWTSRVPENEENDG